MKIYDFVLLGEELAGVWLLKKLCEIRKNLSSGKRPGKKFPKHFLWIRTNVRSQNSYTLPAFIADSFEIELSKTWHLDLVFPNKNFAWNRDRVDSFLLNNPIPREVLEKPSSHSSRTIATIVKTFPELSAISQGIWSAISASETTHDEIRDWSSLLCQSVGTWDVSSQIDSTVEIVDIPRGSTATLTKVNSTEVSLDFSDGKKISTHHVILNLPLSKFQKLFPLNGFANLGFNEDIFSPYAKYEMTLDFEEGTYLPFADSSLLFSTDSSPDVIQETALFEKQASWKLQIIEKKELDLGVVLERFKRALRDLNRGFPTLLAKTKSIYPPLGIESCHSQAYRAEILNDLEASQKDIYGLAQTSYETRMPAVKNLAPSLSCHLPYPLGTLRAADRLLNQYLS